MCLKVGEPRSRLMTSWLQYPESSLITTTSTFFTSIVAAHAKMNIWMTGWNQHHEPASAACP